MTNKEKYLEFCKKNYVPIFSKPWWLDAAVGAENWDVFVIEESGTFWSAMPYYITTKNGYKVITKAPNTQNNGIIFSYPYNQKMPAKLSFQEKCIERTCDYIESLGLAKYEQQFHYSFDNWLPFFWRRYKGIIRYTYVIDTSHEWRDIEENYTSNVRNKLKKANNAVHFSENPTTVREFYEINRMSFIRQGKEIPYSLEFVDRIYKACMENNACKIISAADKDGNIHSAAFLVWDEKSLYYLLNGTNPDFKSSQANYFLINEGIRIAKEKGLLFDFEGSVIRPIERAFREFGGEPKAYFRISKTFEPKLLEEEQNIEMEELLHKQEQ